MVGEKFIGLFVGLMLYLQPSVTNAQTATLVNVGKMTVSKDTKVYVGGTTIQRDSAHINLYGNITLIGDFINNVTQGNVFDTESDGQFEFKGTDLQTITGNAHKDTNYIAFPNVLIAKDDSYVTMTSNMGADIKTLDLQKGKLQLQSDENAEKEDVTTYNAHQPYRLAHLRVDQVKYNRDPLLTNTQKGVVEVEMALALKPDRVNKMFGFASPYKSLYADYFFASYLAAPDEQGLWGTANTSIKDPNTKLLAGHGYIAGQIILPDNRYQLDTKWGDINALFNSKITDKIRLNRYHLDETNNPIANVIAQADKYTVEELNTSDVVMNLKKGWQFIGNPYTCPLDLSMLMQTASGAYDDWKIARTGNNDMGMTNRYYVMAGGMGALDNWTPDKFTINPVWLVGQMLGSTVSLENDDKFLIAPMQVIAIHANEDVTITIPASQRTHEYSKLPSLGGSELLIQVRNDVTVNNAPNSFDRLVLTFMNGFTTDATDIYDVVKTVDSLASPGQIFTQSTDGYALISNMLPPTVKSVEMGMIPTLTNQTMILTAHRIASLTNVSQAWLEDRVAGGAWIDLKTMSEYKFVSQPEDRIDRFVIHINVAANSQVIDPKPLPETLFTYNSLPSSMPIILGGIHAATPIAESSTGPVGSTTTNIQVDLKGNEFCENTEASVIVNPSLQLVNYKVYDKYEGGALKGTAAGNNALLKISVGDYNNNSPEYYYVHAESAAGTMAAIRRLLPVSFEDMIEKRVYPDIRIQSCLGPQTINLSKYIDSSYFVSVEWRKIAGSGVLSGNMFEILGSEKGTQTLEYKVTNKCETAEPSKLYITSLNKDTYVLPIDTVKICYEVADAINLSEIFGVEVVGGQITPVTPGLTPNYFKIAVAPEVFAGAVTFLGKAAYLQNGLLPLASSEYGANAKQAIFKFVPPASQCFTKSEYTLVVILTEE